MKYIHLSVPTLLVLLMSQAHAQQAPVTQTPASECSKQATSNGGSIAQQALRDGDMDRFRRQLLILQDCALEQKQRRNPSVQ